jgi:hypothetical protein
MAIVTTTPQQLKAGDYRCIACTHHWASPSPDCACCENGHCHNCGQGDTNDNTCQCCSMCDTFPCECEAQAAEKSGKPHMRGIPPWEERGVFITADQYKTPGGYIEAWPYLGFVEKLDVCRAAADYYLLDAIRYGVLNRDHDCEGVCGHMEMFSLEDGVRVIRAEAESRFQELVSFLDPLFQEYVEMACGGELRHHPAVGGRVISGDRRSAWCGWKDVRQALGWDAVKDMADLFYDWGPDTGYGGPKWANAAELLYDRIMGKMNAAQWVDRVFSLVHNGGVFLNKLKWGVENKRQWDLAHLQARVLPAHASDGFNILLSVSSPEIRKLWDDNWRAMNKARMRGGLRPQPNLSVVVSQRHICRSCSSNPARGHLLRCGYFEEGYLQSGKYKMAKPFIATVEEEEWPEWNWGVWSMDSYPVSPDGIVSLQSTDIVSVRIGFHRGLAIYEMYHNGTVADLFRTQIVCRKKLPAVHLAGLATESYGGQNVEVDIELMSEGHNRAIGGKTIKVHRSKITALILDLGLVLPEIEGVNWDKAVTDYISALSA